MPAPSSIASIVGTRLASAPIPAVEVMDLALYHPEFGYYRRTQGPWGFEGKDYYTALDQGPLLGETLALRLETAWINLGQPNVFTVLEPGAGRGWLGRDILRSARAPFVDTLRYLYRDNNPAGRHEAQESLAPWIAKDQATLLYESDPLPSFVGAILSNELFDALPAQPWRWSGQAWEREMLTSEGSAWEPAEPGEAGSWFASHSDDGLEAGDGSTWCGELPAIVKELSDALEHGLFLAIDYGDTAARLLAKGSDIRRFRAHQVDGRWWEDLGAADLTADVDFTRLGHLLKCEGFEATTTTSLGRWLRAHAPLATWEAQWQTLDDRERQARMQNLLQLSLPGMMGDRFKVLEAWRA